MSELTLYNDSFINISLSQTPISRGHMIISPTDSKKKTLGELDDLECDMLFYGASYGATAVFEFLKEQGSNIILNENEDGVSVNVFGRRENDNLNLNIQGEQANPAELQEVAGKIKDAIDYEVWAEQNPEEAAKAGKVPEPKKAQELNVSDAETVDDEGNTTVNYLLKSLRRTP